eukprot:gb/GEZN01016984.1/.p1 GENE.gb/GEZN01016984.1/~~gb/GEZN01016984.1/.p1  ORF type:complete len:213 (+),score=16.30 gb/GEZN01016984.1/:3-641(+)
MIGSFSLHALILTFMLQLLASQSPSHRTAIFCVVLVVLTNVVFALSCAPLLAAMIFTKVKQGQAVFNRALSRRGPSWQAPTVKQLPHLQAVSLSSVTSAPPVAEDGGAISSSPSASLRSITMEESPSNNMQLVYNLAVPADISSEVVPPQTDRPMASASAQHVSAHPISSKQDLNARSAESPLLVIEAVPDFQNTNVGTNSSLPGDSDGRET